ncbi:peptide/nickel transporter ATP-binding protein [Kutzneria sp. 744]|nr:peptide/nickel transporter ATP-binding protein [Kutzneria sp. 744]
MYFANRGFSNIVWHYALGSTTLVITHDLATARHFSDDIIVMYRGRVVERGPADQVILTPRHPYTQLLAASVPDPDARGRELPAATEIAGSSTRAYDHYAGAWQ